VCASRPSTHITTRHKCSHHCYTHDFLLFFFLKDTAPPEIYTLPLHDALPISHTHTHTHTHSRYTHTHTHRHTELVCWYMRSEEHTSETQSHLNPVSRSCA